MNLGDFTASAALLWLTAAVVLGVAELIIPGVFVVFLALAAAMRAAAEDRDLIDRVIDEARDAALAEIGDALVVQPAIVDLVPDADYERERKGRIRALKEIDLATLGELSIYRDLLQ